MNLLTDNRGCYAVVGKRDGKTWVASHSPLHLALFTKRKDAVTFKYGLQPHLTTKLRIAKVVVTVTEARKP